MNGFSRSYVRCELWFADENLAPGTPQRDTETDGDLSANLSTEEIAEHYGRIEFLPEPEPPRPNEFADLDGSASDIVESAPDRDQLLLDVLNKLNDSPRHGAGAPETPRRSSPTLVGINDALDDLQAQHDRLVRRSNPGASSS